MLFVDDNEAEIFEGAKKSRARADDERDVTRADFVPAVAPLSMAESVVQNSHALLKAAAQSLDSLGGEGDFWDKKKG